MLNTIQNLSVEVSLIHNAVNIMLLFKIYRTDQKETIQDSYFFLIIPQKINILKISEKKSGGFYNGK